MSKVCNLPSFQSQFKVAVIGCGNVGAAAAYAMLLEGTVTDMVLVDHTKEKAQGLLLDFEHSMSFLKHVKLTATDDYSACKGAHMVVVTAGARQMEGETRLQLIDKNRAIMKDMIPAIAKAAPNAILLMVTNPVDVLTYEALKLSGFPENRVFGTGTYLDTARFRFHLGEKLCISPKSIHAYILGEHGDTSFPVYSSATIAGKPIREFEGFSQKMMEQCYQDTRDAAYRIIHDMGYTCYSIGVVIREIVMAIHQHSRTVIPLSVVLHDYYDHNDVALSIPCVVDSTGIADVIKVPLDEKEQQFLEKSVMTIKSYLR